jgi:glutamyl/glutaminyl-tRNA synthetase
MFSREQFVDWFGRGHVSRSAAQFNPEKLAWRNQQYLKSASVGRVVALVEPWVAAGPPLFVSAGMAWRTYACPDRLSRSISYLPWENPATW